jgi:hypothetical protein
VQVPEGEVDNEERRRPDFRRHISDASVDDGLRMTISRTDQYGLTGQKKVRNAPGTIALGSGRRLSTKDFIKQMQQLDPKNKIKELDESDAPDEVKRELRKGARVEATTPGDRAQRSPGDTDTGVHLTVPRPARTRRTPSERATDADDYFSRPRPDRVDTRDEPHRTLEEESEEDDDDEMEGEIPTHNVISSLAKHSQGQTAADLRRRQLARIRSEEEEEEAPGEGETAAEKRRRLAALGLGDGDDDSSSESDEEGNQPRRNQAAVPEPSEGGPSGQQPRARIQWGGESGREGVREVAPEEETTDLYAGDPIVGAARKLRRMMKKRHE